MSCCSGRCEMYLWRESSDSMQAVLDALIQLHGSVSALYIW